MIDLRLGDCLEAMHTLPANSIDTCITDPPYALEFMGKGWDKVLPSVDVWREVLRVLKPGAMLMAFGGTRTFHRLTTSIEDAGFEIRDCMMFLHGQGFPKSLNIQKQLEKSDAICRCAPSDDSVRGVWEGANDADGMVSQNQESDLLQTLQRDTSFKESGEVQQQREGEGSSWDGAGGSEQSSMEGRRNVLQEEGELQERTVSPSAGLGEANGPQRRIHHGASVGDGKLGGATSNQNRSSASHRPQSYELDTHEFGVVAEQQVSQDGRTRSVCRRCGKSMESWTGFGTALKPAWEPIILAMKPLDGTFAQNAQQWGVAGLNIDAGRVETFDNHSRLPGKSRGVYSNSRLERRTEPSEPHVLGRWPANLLLDEEAVGMLGEPSRFFYTAKASRSERDAGLGDMPLVTGSETTGRKEGSAGLVGDKNNKGQTANPYSNGAPVSRNFHPTIKPLALMEYLCKLTRTPTGGIVLDPFMGSGTTGLACINTGRSFIGIEIDAGYFAIAEKRVPHGAPCDVHALRSAGMSLPEIAREAHLSVPEVARLLRG